MTNISHNEIQKPNSPITNTQTSKQHDQLLGKAISAFSSQVTVPKSPRCLSSSIDWFLNSK